MINDDDICRAIVAHLGDKINRQDNLTGINLAVSAKAFSKFQQRILKNVRRLVELDIIEQAVTTGNDPIFTLVIPTPELEAKLHKKSE